MSGEGKNQKVSNYFIQCPKSSSGQAKQDPDCSRRSIPNVFQNKLHMFQLNRAYCLATRGP